MPGPSPRSFPTPAAFRAWLRRHHRQERELILRCFKVHAAHRGVTYAQALDEALCYGWIDGVRRALDGDSFTVRFTPRKPKSYWSRVNVGHAERLKAAGRMTKPGLAAYEARQAGGGAYSFEARHVVLSPALRRRFQADRAAWTWYRAQAPWYRRTSAFWVMSAKREATRERRLETLITCSARGRTIPPLTRTP